MQCSLWALVWGALALVGAPGPADPLVLALDAAPKPDVAPVPDTALDVAHVAALDTALGLRLFQAVVAAAPGNAALSPTGAATLLRALQLVARGPGQAQLRTAAGYAPHEPGAGQLEVALGGAGVALAAGIFVQHDLPLVPSTTVLAPLLQRVDFRHPASARRAINAWARTHTHGRIGELVGAGVLAGGAARLVLANTVHVSSAWARPFDPRATRPRPFHVPHRPPTLVPTMAQAGRFLHGEFTTAEGLEYEVVELPYARGGLSLLLAVPLVRDAPLAPLARTLSASLIRAWTRGLSPRPRLLLLPRFSLEAECDLRTPLRALGIRDVFNPHAADLSGLTLDEPLFVSQALHKVKFEVMEGGTQAAAGTAAVFVARMAPPELALDRPFLFILRHNPTGAVLFVGQVIDP
ncbi:plasminogen activator inhibitor 1 [Alligator mississippiensis]|uniref:plasminogen activator inhibitor 1 n=1 Tax=Alligator mississippiensis TaxID=8496 RepID=UPI00287730FE|nr:plasminogen activator inhibitor 1 [Alligator mississippiensis]